MKTIYELLKETASAANKGMSSTILSLPGTGKTFHLKQIDYKEVFPDDFSIITIHIGDLAKRTSKYFYNHLLVELSTSLIALNQDSSEIPADIIQALQINNEALLIATIKKTIKILIKEKSKLLFILDDFSLLSNLDKDFFNSLRNIRFVNKSKINFLFLENISTHSAIDKETFGDLYNYMNESILYLPLPTEEGFNKVFDQLSKEYKQNDLQKIKALLEKLTYGHPGLLKYTITNIIKNSNKLDTTSIIKETGIINSISSIANDLQPNLLTHLYNPIKGSDETNTLIKLGLLRKNEKDELVPPGIFLEFKDKLLITEKGRKTDKKGHSNTKTSITLKDGIISVKGSQTKEPLSNREYKILQHFDKHRNKVVSRDELGKVIWGNKVTEEYSEWAIDQSISRLRKKLGDNAYKPEYLKTIRGRGFILED